MTPTTLRELADKLTKSAQIFHEYAFDENCANVTQAIEELRRYADLLDDKVVVVPREPVAWMWRHKPWCEWPGWVVSIRRPIDAGCTGGKDCWHDEPHRPVERAEGYEDYPLYAAAPAMRGGGVKGERSN